VNLLVYFEPATLCNLREADLVLAPLPEKKQLWETNNEFAWKTERERDPVRSIFGLAANGELVNIGNGFLYCGDMVLLHKSFHMTTPSWSTANWEEWCSGMDGFGGLVMLAASLIA